MNKVTGLASFTKRSLPSPSSLEASVAPIAITTSPEPRARGIKSQVAMTFRLPRQEWERLHQLAIAEGVSINTLTLRGLSKLFEERGLPGVKS
jgi:hypothetical protein